MCVCGCLCVCVCVCVCVCMCVCVWVFVCVTVSLYERIRVFMHSCMCDTVHDTVCALMRHAVRSKSSWLKLRAHQHGYSIIRQSLAVGQGQYFSKIWLISHPPKIP